MTGVQTCALPILEIDPEYPLAHWALGLTYEQKGLYEDAINELQKPVMPGGWMIAGLGHAYAIAGQRENALKILEDLIALSKQTYVSAYDVATMHAALNQRDSCLKWLAKAYDEHSVWLPFMGVDPKLKNLHSDPNFGLLLERIGLHLHTKPA